MWGLLRETEPAGYTCGFVKRLLGGHLNFLPWIAINVRQRWSHHAPSMRLLVHLGFNALYTHTRIHWAEGEGVGSEF